jgi:hypothetical protein
LPKAGVVPRAVSAVKAKVVQGKRDVEWRRLPEEPALAEFTRRPFVRTTGLGALGVATSRALGGAAFAQPTSTTARAAVDPRRVIATVDRVSSDRFSNISAGPFTEGSSNRDPRSPIRTASAATS